MTNFLRYGLLLFGALLIAKPVAAFLSPSTLSLIANSIGGFLWGLVILVAVNVAVFFKGIKKRHKHIVRVASILVVLVLLVLVVQRYIRLKELNNVYDSEFVEQYEFDLMSMSEEELAQYKIFYAQHTLSRSLNVWDTLHIVYLNASTLMKFFDTSVEDFAQDHNVTRDDKILFICEAGSTSKRAIQRLREQGYTAYFGRLSRVIEDANATIFSNTSVATSSLIVVPYNDESDLLYVDFGMYINRNLHRFGIDIIHYTVVDRDVLLTKNILCDENLHCILTKYLLDQHGITKKKIYKIEVPEDNYAVPI